MDIPTSNATGAYLTITVDELVNLRLVALGRTSPTLIIRRGLILALHTGEILERDVVISGRHIAAITPWNHVSTIDNEIDATGKYISPGFIDTHLHIEYTKLVPAELARLSVPRGTTTVLADANCIANVLGEEGMDFMRTTKTPLRIFQQVSHKVPGGDPEIEMGGVRIATETLAHRVSQSFAATLGESNPFSLDRASAVKQAAALHAGKRITGHTALLSNEPLWAYAAGGIGDDHNAHRPEDVVERLRLGLMLTVMSGSMNSNIESVFSDISQYKAGLNHMSFCADDKFAEDLHREGHIDFHVREAIRYGVEPVQAYRIATLNAALYYRIDHLIGSITPAKLADLLVLDNLEDAKPSIVIVNGKVVARDNKASFVNNDPVPPFTLNTIHLNPTFFDPSTYRTYPKQPKAKHVYIQAVEMYDGYFKRAFHTPLQIHPTEGHLLSDLSNDVLKLVVIDRHHKTTNHGTAFVRGFKLKRGAIACTTNCENQNLVILGTSDEEIAFAAKAIHVLGGGYVAVAAGDVLGSVELAVAGCMSLEPYEEVVRKSRQLDEIVQRELVGGEPRDAMKVPFMILSFVGLVGVPDLGVTELGLVHTAKQELINVLLDEQEVGNHTLGVASVETLATRAQGRKVHSSHPTVEEPTIYALSTASGRAAIAVIRVSGPACRRVYQGLCPSKAFPKPRHAALRKLYTPNLPPSISTLLDSGALVLYFPAPNTVTGEDVLELHVHGGPAIVRAVLAAIPQCVESAGGVKAAGARIRYAEPGEFTRRAFANSRMDLPQIESLGETLSATTEQQRMLSVRGTTSKLATRYECWRTLLLQARGELEALIDFSEDQHFDESPAALCASVAYQVQNLSTLIEAHVANAVRGELLRSGISVALLGAPNAGKSSLLNRIVGREAAIVSHEAGTTRDVVEVGVDLGGWLVKIGDMAGLRKAGLVGADVVGAVEEEGIKRAKQRALQSDVLIVVQDATATMDPEVVETAKQCVDLGINVVVAINKIDQLDDPQLSDNWKAKVHDLLRIPAERIFFVSCREAEQSSRATSSRKDPGQVQAFLHGLLETFRGMTAALVPGSDPDPSIWQESLGATERQRALLSECLLHLDSFLKAVQDPSQDQSRSVAIEIDEPDAVDIVIAAESLRLAADALAKITGRGEGGDVEEVLGVVFEK
ncbi:hypothetical protein N0V90_012239 [Kalmusia sp. IMI 367209]|nr:hypothetical protein N0V90_012239 [Kalmusia sp. IMI 367209]